LNLLDVAVTPNSASVVSYVKGQIRYAPNTVVGAGSDMGAVVVSTFQNSPRPTAQLLTALAQGSTITGARYEPFGGVGSGWLALEMGSGSSLSSATTCQVASSKVGACLFIAGSTPSQLNLIGATGTASVRALAADPTDHAVFAVGQVLGDVSYPTGCATPNSAGLEGWYVMRVSPNGACFVMPAGGSGAMPDDVSIDSATSIAYVVGTSAARPNSGFDQVGSVIDQNAVTVAEMNEVGATRVLAAYSNDGGVVWAKGLPTWSTDSSVHPAHVLVHGTTVWVAAAFNGQFTSDAGTLHSAGENDIALVGVDARTGQVLMTHRLGGPGDEQIADLSYEPSHGLALAGTTSNAAWSEGSGSPVGTAGDQGSFLITYAVDMVQSPVVSSQRFYKAANGDGLIRRARFDASGATEPVVGGTLAGGSINFFETAVSGTGIFIGVPTP
jgi:hypothetical protein